jgi:hypothetical protein
MYHHTQVGRVTLIALATGMAVLGVLLVLIREPAVDILLASLLGVLALTALCFSTLTVTVDGRSVTARFGPGLIRRRIELDKVRAVWPVKNLWWYGWGVHWTPHGWLWNVSGLGAVELDLKDGRGFRIGTDEPDELAASIENALQAAR